MFRVGLAMLAANALLAPAAVGPAAVGPAAAGASPTWAVAPAVPLPREGVDAMLRDVSMISPSDVWVVGHWNGDRRHPLSLRWDGAAWTTLPTPDSPDGSTTYVLNAVDAVTANDAWAVGGVVETLNPAKATPLLLHHNGTAWTEAPGVPGMVGELSDVDLLTVGEGWAVGTHQGRPIILRLDGERWRSVPAPAFEVDAYLESVHVLPDGDAWAVGYLKSGGLRTALVLRWDGEVWHDVTIPSPPESDTVLVNVAAASNSDVWAVGSRCVAMICQPWVLHLTGTTWDTEQAAPGAILTAVVAFAPDDVWIFGQANGPLGAMVDHVEHWDGTRLTPDPNVPPHMGLPHHPGSARTLAAASGHHPTRDLWAVGWIENSKKTTHAIYTNGSAS